MAKSGRFGKKIGRAAKKQLQKTHPATFIIPLLFLVIGLVLGYVGAGVLWADNGFALYGKTEYTVTVGSDFAYRDEGFFCTAVGQNISDAVSISTNMTKNSDGTYTLDTADSGEYYISYTCQHPVFYRNVRLVRVIHVVESEVAA